MGAGTRPDAATGSPAAERPALNRLFRNRPRAHKPEVMFRMLVEVFDTHRIARGFCVTGKG